MTSPQSPHDNSVYPIPQGVFSEPVPTPAIPQSGIAHSVEMIQTDYSKIASEAHDDATRFARSIYGEDTPLYTQTAREFEMRVPAEIQQLKDIETLITQAQNQSVAELAAEINGMMHAVSNVMGSIGIGGNIEETIRRDLKREEAEIAGRLIGTVPDNESWRFYPSEGEWFIERAMVSAKTTPYSVVHYAQDLTNPTRLIKSESRQGYPDLRYEFVESDELKALVALAGQYYKEIVTLPARLRQSKSTRHRLSR